MAHRSHPREGAHPLEYIVGTLVVRLRIDTNHS